jgi:hypothetical protein
LENAAAAENRGKLSYPQDKISGQHPSPPRSNDPYTPVIDRSSYPLIEPLSMRPFELSFAFLDSYFSSKTLKQAITTQTNIST